MFQLINSILLDFRKSFKREKTWRWFVVLVVGFMVRIDLRGVTSVVTALGLKPSVYHTMLHFFRSDAYRTRELSETWTKTAIKHCHVKRIAGRVVLLGDHSKVSKEGLRMPDIQILHQDSQNSGKPKFIEGHNYAQVSAVITNDAVSRSLPLMTELQVSPKKREGTKEKDGESLVSQMVTLTHRAAQAIGEAAYVALDAYYSSAVAWTAADRTVTEEGVKLIEIVTRAQTNTVVFTVPEPPKKRKRGQPKKYGEKVFLYGLFANTSRFTKTTMTLYGKPTEVEYLCLDLIWKPVKKLVRFVLAKTDSGYCVLMSSDLNLAPQDVIFIYSLRFKIETSFDEQKNDMGCFAYHFWTSALAKRRRWKNADLPDDAKLCKRINDAKKATDAFVCLNTIATGILTIIAFSHNREIWQRYPGYIRTLRSVVPTVATTKLTLSHVLKVSLPILAPLPAFGFITPLLREADYLFLVVA